MADWILENPDNVAGAEIVVAVSSRNDAGSIAFPTEQASLGLNEYFRGRKAVIVNCDNGSTDGTKEAFFAAPCQVQRIHVSTPPNVVGKGNAFKNLLRLVRNLGAEAIVVVDADLKSITPKWIKHLGEPLFDDFGFVAPLYLRHKYDGNLTNNIAYPLTRCLYGRRVRQPIVGDFGFSGELAQFFLGHESWDDDVARSGIGIWLATLAMYQRKPITQAFLGRPKIHKPREPSVAPGEVFREVTGTILHLMETFAPFWREVRWSRPTAIYGFGLGETEMPPPVNVDAEELFSGLRGGAAEHGEVWREALAASTYRKLQEVLDLELPHFEFPTPLWAQCLFDAAVAYRDRILPRDQLLDSLAPLYLGKTLSYVRATEGLAMHQAEEYVEEQCLAFEEAKPYLLSRWGA
ncbi:MAG: glycosyl transferase [Deltaproteobacteria bacterium]|nr:glycosyl transferase [Deltaproteobacteria bacterium]